MSILRILLCAIWFPMVANSDTCKNLTHNHYVKSVGLPPYSPSTLVTWWSVSSLDGQALQYDVFYNKTSRYNHCEYPGQEPLYLAPQCRRKIVGAGVKLTCNINEAVIKLKLVQSDSFCVLIRARSLSSNYTCYSNYEECSLYDGKCAICPAPENVHIYANKKRTLTVLWDAPKYINKDIQQDFIRYKIYCRAINKDGSETKTTTCMNVPNIGYKPSRRINITCELSSLDNYQMYSVWLECDLYFSENWGIKAGPYNVTTMEQAPSLAPEFQNYNKSIRDGTHMDLYLTWKAPPRDTWNGRPLRFDIEYWKTLANNTCSTAHLLNSSVQLQNILGGYATHGRIDGLQYGLQYCFRIRMCTNPGCGPWNGEPLMITMMFDEGTTQVPSVNHLTYVESIVGIILVALIIAVIVVGFITYRHTRQNGATRRRSLQERFGDPTFYQHLDNDTPVIEEGDYAEANATTV